MNKLKVDPSRSPPLESSSRRFVRGLLGLCLSLFDFSLTFLLLAALCEDVCELIQYVGTLVIQAAGHWKVCPLH